MTALQKISQEAKRIYKANPKLSWTECIKKASLLYAKKKKNVVVKKIKSTPTRVKKAAVKKAIGVVKNVAKKSAIKKTTKQSGYSNEFFDSLHQAKKPGKRTTAWGTTYYESRANRSDKGVLLGMKKRSFVSGYKLQPEVIVNSVGNIKKIQNFVPELKVRINRGKSVQNNKVTGSKSASDIFKKFIGKNKIETQEFFAIMYLTNSANVIGVYITSMGGITSTVADKRLIIGTALQLGATSMIICHNHPSGNLNPSSADRNFTTALIRDAKEFEISVLDHIIITKDSYFSFADNGII